MKRRHRMCHFLKTLLTEANTAACFLQTCAVSFFPPQNKISNGGRFLPFLLKRVWDRTKHFWNTYKTSLSLVAGQHSTISKLFTTCFRISYQSLCIVDQITNRDPQAFFKSREILTLLTTPTQCIRYKNFNEISFSTFTCTLVNPGIRNKYLFADVRKSMLQYKDFKTVWIVCKDCRGASSSFACTYMACNCFLEIL